MKDFFIRLNRYKEGDKANFYIQSHGDHAGRPLKKPIPNCFSVFTNRENAFEIVFSLYISRAFYQLIRGSVIPFIVKKETMILLEENFRKKFDAKKLNIVMLYTQLLDNQLKTIEKTKELQIGFAQQLVKEI